MAFWFLFLGFLAAVVANDGVFYSSGNPVILSFRDLNWRSYLTTFTTDPPSFLPSMEDKMHADLQLICPARNPVWNGEDEVVVAEEDHRVDLLRLHEKWTALLPGHSYLLPHLIWKRWVTQEDLANVKDCFVKISAKPNMAIANHEWEFHPDLSRWWIRLPFHRATERLFFRGEGKEANWVDDTQYEQSFALRALSNQEKVGRLDIYCPAFLDQYEARNPILAQYLFRTDEQPVEEYAFLFENITSFQDFEERSKEGMETIPKVQPATFLSSSWPDFQAYLEHELHCDMEFVTDAHVWWVSIQEWHSWHEEKAKALVERFPYLEIIDREPHVS